LGPAAVLLAGDDGAGYVIRLAGPGG
jgi:hypothetical protein